MNREQAINYLISSGFTNEQVGEVVRALTYEPTTKNNLGVDKFDKAINQSDLEEWIMETFPDWCEGDVRLIMNHMDEMPSVTPQLSVPEVTALAEWTEKLTKASEDAYNKGYEAGRKEQESSWIPVKTINQCYIPELKDYHGKVLATYLTGKHIKPQVTTISISYGRIENKKYTDIVAIMYLPEPYSEVDNGNDD